VPRHAKRQDAIELEIVGWTIPVWSLSVGHSDSTTYVLLAAGIIEARRSGGRTIITTPPKQYLDSCPKWKPGGKLRGKVDPVASRRVS
jgi:hypothetical protein